MAKRQIIEIPGVVFHGPNPIPAAVKIGNMVYTGGVSGRDQATNAVPDDPEAQVRNVFANLRRIMELAGGSTDDIAKIDVRLRDLTLREVVNRYWVEMFPDADNRPARHTAQATLPANYAIQVEMVAVL